MSVEPIVAAEKKCLAQVVMRSGTSFMIIPGKDLTPVERRSLDDRLLRLPERRFDQTYRAMTCDTGMRNLEVLSRLFEYGELEYDQDAYLVIRHWEVSSQLMEQRSHRRLEYTFDMADPPPPENYVPRTTPYKHQSVALDSIHDIEFFALLMDMGTGKSKVIVDEVAWQVRNGKTPFRLLIICPKSLLWNWKDQFAKHLPTDITWFYSAGGSEGELVNSFLQGMQSGCQLQVWALNPHKVLNPINKEFIEKMNFPLCVVDESTMIKNPYAKTTETLLAMAPTFKRRIILNGSPAPNSVLDLWSQFNFLMPGCLGFAKYDHFRSHYAMVNSETGTIEGIKNYEELKKRMAYCSFIVQKSDCLRDLPEKAYSRRTVVMSKGHAKIYRDMAEKLLAEIEGMEQTKATANIILVKLLRLSQICSGFLRTEEVRDDGTRTVEIPDGDIKLKELGEFLDETRIPETSKLLVWARFKHDVHRISKFLTSRNIRCEELTGDTSDSERERISREFNTNEGADVIIGEPGVAGFGLTLVGTAEKPVQYVIYYSSDFSLTKRLQSEDRCHRIGMHSAVTYIDICCEGSVDEYIVDRLQSKRQMQNELLDTRVLRDILFGKVPDKTEVTTGQIEEMEYAEGELL